MSFSNARQAHPSVSEEPTHAEDSRPGVSRLQFQRRRIQPFKNFTLALWPAGLTSSYLLIGLLGNSRSFEGAIVSPLAGAWSDRTWAGWLGRRRPFILVGGLMSAVLVALTPTISRLAGAGLLARSNLMDDVHQALRSDCPARKKCPPWLEWRTSRPRQARSPATPTLVSASERSAE